MTGLFDTLASGVLTPAQQKTKSAPKQPSYSAEDIEVLEGLEPVRRRPGMYIGGTDERSLHHLVSEVLDNAMDEAVAGYASDIYLTLHDDGSVSVKDNGRGIPVDPHPKFQDKSALEVILTTLHSGGKFSNKVYDTSGGLHGVGISVVNALSITFEATIWRDHKKWIQKYAQGAPITPLISEKSSDKNTGTLIHFSPDPSIFPIHQFKAAILYKMARSKAYLHRGVRIHWQGPASTDVPEQDTFHFPNGVLDYLNQEVGTAAFDFLQEPFHGVQKIEDQKSRVEWAVTWQPTGEGFLRSYCNTVPTPLGGTHENGLRQALVKSLKDFGELTKNKRASKITADDILGSSSAVLSIFIPDPEFQGQTKEKLSSVKAARLVENTIKDQFDHWLSAHTDVANKLLDFFIDLAEERQRLKAAREANRKSATQRLRLPGKLADCTQRSPEGTEIFLVEGDSAGGSAKQARDRATQAVLPLRGKILNVASATFDKMQANQEISDLQQALGCGVRQHYQEDKLRYERVVIMTDADVDGAHIAALLMTFFFREMRSMVKNGHLYLAHPPLYRLTQGTKSLYVYSDAEKEAAIAAHFPKGKVDISRFKGLGEMTPKQLRDTTMHVESRIIYRVNLEDLEGFEDQSIEDFVEDLMGKRVEPRFQFIQNNAQFVRELDL
jgi:topoisomerase-4 subunit B